MSNNQINQAVVDTVLRNLRNGDFHQCQKLGFTENELITLSKLSVTEIHDLCNNGISTFLDIRVNHQMFFNLLNVARNRAKELTTIDRALALGISGEMLRHRFGWSSAEVSARRKLLGISESIGRKTKASYEEETKVWELWKKHRPSDTSQLEDSSEGLDLLIFIAEETGIAITEIWRLISRWIEQ